MLEYKCKMISDNIKNLYNLKKMSKERLQQLNSQQESTEILYLAEPIFNICEEDQERYITRKYIKKAELIDKETGRCLMEISPEVFSNIYELTLYLKGIEQNKNLINKEYSLDLNIPVCIFKKISDDDIIYYAYIDL